MASVLVADDETAVCAAIKLALEREGHAVTVTANGRAAMAALAAEHFDLLILDIFMPDMDGFETIKEVHRHRPGLPVVVITGTSIFSTMPEAPDFLAMAVKLGAVRGLRKPFTPDQLLGAVNESLGREAQSRRRGNQ
jgi:DNA-binding NtrC family response regulator